MGGLISNTTANTDSGVPFLKDIPILGYAFKKNKVTLFRTELIVLITPYIINDSTEARAAVAATTWCARQSTTSWRTGSLRLAIPLPDGGIGRALGRLGG